MRFALSAVVVAVSLASASLGAMLQVESFAGSTKPNSFIVTLRPGVSKALHLEENPSIAAAVTHADWNASLLNGFAGTFNQTQLDSLRANSDVLSISENGIMHAMAAGAVTAQTNAPWGLQRISQQAAVTGSSTALNFTYHFDSTAGTGVDIYVVDTGINTAHTDFGGRATFVAVAQGLPGVDDNGHGTHIAATAIGTRFGVAKLANAIGIKVLASDGTGTVADIIAGLNFVGQQARSSGRPSIASVALGGPTSSPLDDAVSSLISAGIHVIVPAGNDNTNAANNSPARVTAAITVGSMNIGNSRSSFSNTGAVVDIFAPGENVVSAFRGSSTATSTQSGTSMATAHVVGLVAYFIGLNGNVPPATMATNIRNLGLTGLLGGVPGGTSNDLAYNGM
ncbi:peptidase 1 [Exidia glandulosa HHB12029]|uniref:Peptidase 1 n=1 Tax=Exidia glandulosa HHB12029 TaxID=1314781 RepID=A0A165GYP8_EXIGL|nr:peptidase 1 [Exidia glandulosa HHB12029]